MCTRAHVCPSHVRVFRNFFASCFVLMFWNIGIWQTKVLALARPGVQNGYVHRATTAPKLKEK